ncbi:hypothetical protein GCM10010123_40950 [Pilimelia anulata]|uniref:Membrane transport protein MMPL domain-containing protein n=1 Tax=Pilimelia anulata TaxID=53371 RepID=A0A8J3FFX9_9ACTN|nr:MMPL family transporter [Pilimelia anulata]GGK06990.1 hypothetical protein GCM10010123_40950 [Pilimelia anulata]
MTLAAPARPAPPRPAPDPPPAGRLALLGRWCARYRWLVLLLWAAVAAGGAAAAGPVAERASTLHWAAAPHESVEGQRLLDRAAAPGERTGALVAGVRPADPAVAAALDRARAALAAVPGVAAVDPPVPAAAAVLLTVTLDPGRADPGPLRAAVDARLRALPADLARAGAPGATVTIGGSARAVAAVTERTRAQSRTAEFVALPAVALLLWLIFGGLRPALIPAAAALATVGGGMLALLALSGWRVLDAPLLSLTTVCGLGLAVDYSLLGVVRFREERAAGRTVVDAVAAATARAGRAVAFSGLTVAAALGGLWVFPSPFFTSIALAGMAVTLIALAAALTLTPALLAVLGRRFPPARPPAPEGAFSRLARLVRRRPALVALLAAVPLAAAVAPFLRVELLHPHAADQVAPATEVRRYREAVRAHFPAAADDVVVVARATAADLRAWLAALPPRPGVTPAPPLPAAAPGGVAPGGTEPAAAPGAAVPTRAADAGPGLWVVPVAVPADPANAAAAGAVAHLRAHRPGGFPIWVTGNAALQVDHRDELVAYAPRAAAVVVASTLLLLLLLTRAVLVPLKAVLINVLSLGASFGALVLIFQDGYLAGPLGVHTVGGVQFWVPVVLFVLAFGLSMDYEVFLLARVKEAYDEGHPNDRAVELGLQRSGRVITSAAVLTIAVFAIFAHGPMLGIKQFGVGMAIAVAVDATIVRCLLVPALMTLLGDRNWWPGRRRTRGVTP